MFLGTWSIGVLVGLPIFVIVASAFLVGIIAGIRHHRSTPSYNVEGMVVAALCGIGLVVAVAFAAWGFYPYSKEYHYWDDTQGVVESVDKRIVGGDNISEKFVVRYTDGRERGCLDTRCGSVRPGDTLVLTCKRAWQFTGTDGYDCNFVSNTRPR